MEIFSYMSKYGYEQLVFNYDATSGLKAIIAIHNTTLGPALGGCRIWPYDSEEAAVIDALRLARGMTYKNAAAGLNIGGGKAVIIADPKKDKTEALFRAFGRFVESLGGRYITAEDVGTSVEDMDIVALETRHVCGVSSANSSGDPSPVTAYGVWHGMKASAHEVYGSDSLKGKTIAVQGLGHVGYYLCRHLAEEGAKLYVTDIDGEKVDRVAKELGATAVAPEEIYDINSDIFAPCALGAILDDKTIPRLKSKIVCGAANNQLQEDRHGDLLMQKGILYAPDYIVNAGGVINVADELQGYNRERALRKAAGIYQNMQRVIAISKRDKVGTHIAADRMAEERIRAIGSVKRTFLGSRQR